MLPCRTALVLGVVLAFALCCSAKNTPKDPPKSRDNW